jgi:hypothetical protein
MGKKVVAVALLLIFSGRWGAGADETPLRVSMLDPAERMAVQRAVRAAARLLALDRCQQLFSDFADAAGRPLGSKLAELEVSGANYLEWVRFEDGAGLPRCSRPDVLAATLPGSRVVFVCGARFRRAYLNNPAHAVALVIHEMLHSLGLGENPPTGDEITQRVRDRCLGPSAGLSFGGSQGARASEYQDHGTDADLVAVRERGRAG